MKSGTVKGEHSEEGQFREISLKSGAVKGDVMHVLLF